MNWALLWIVPLCVVGGLLLLLICLVLLLTLFPVKVDVRYEAQNLFVKLKIFGLSRSLVDPTKETPTKKEPKKKKEKQQKKPKEKKKQNTMTLAKVGYAGLKILSKGGPLTVDKLSIRVTFGGNDPADLGILFGRVHMALGIVWPMLQKIIVIKNPSIQTELDFALETTQLHDAHVVIPIPLVRILHILLVVLLRYNALTQEDTVKKPSTTNHQN